MDPAPQEQLAGHRPGAIVRSVRQSKGLTLAQLGQKVGYSAAQVSRYERGIAPLTDVAVLRRFAAALAIPPRVFGLAPVPVPAQRRHGHALTPTAGPSRVSSLTVAGGTGREDGEDPVRRRQLLVHLAVTAAATATTQLTGQIRASASGAASTGDLLVSRIRDAMLGLTPAPSDLSEDSLHAGLAAALTDFRRCRYSRLADGLPRLISGGHTLAAAERHGRDQRPAGRDLHAGHPDADQAR